MNREKRQLIKEYKAIGKNPKEAYQLAQQWWLFEDRKSKPPKPKGK